MSYRCSFCDGKVPHGTPLRKHIVYKRSGQIKSESPICAECIKAKGKVSEIVVPGVVMPGAAMVGVASLHEVEKVQPKPEKVLPIRGRQGAVNLGLSKTLADRVKNGKVSK